MKTITFFCIAATLALSGLSEDTGVTKGESSALAAITAQTEAYMLFYNSRDADKLSELWSENAVYTLPITDEQLLGRDPIRKMFTELFTRDDLPKLEISIDSIRFVSSSVAIEKGTVRTIEVDGTVSSEKYSAINVKVDDKWLLDSIIGSESTDELANSRPLKELEWMVGSWIDESDDSTVETNYQWTKNKSFLTNNFRVIAPNTDELEGTQVIGWDPLNQIVRSWVFDSDGGFSQGSWSKKGDSWIVESKGFTVDGQSVSSIQVFSHGEIDSFHWQSFGRQVGTTRLPDIAEVKIVRKK